jgi:hypothetical protein
MSGAGESAAEAPPEPLADVRAHRWVNAPLLSGLSGASTDEQRLRRGPAQIHKGNAGEILGLTTRRRVVVAFYPHSPQIHDPWICGRR